MDTNYYTSMHKEVSYERNIKISSRQVENREKIDLALERAGTQELALEILLGANCGRLTSKVDAYVHQIESPYMTYGKVNQPIVLYKLGIINRSQSPKVSLYYFLKILFTARKSTVLFS